MKTKFNEWQRKHRAAKRSKVPKAVHKYQTNEALRRDHQSKMKWSEANREHRAWHYIEVKYGLTREAYEQLLTSQKCRCAINPDHVETEDYKTKASRRGGFWHIDHDHHTGRVRGILCRTCNTALGSFGDSLDGLMLAVDYMHRVYGLAETVEEHW